MSGVNVTQVSMCSVLGAVVIALILYNIYKDSMPPKSPRCDACGNGATSARRSNCEKKPFEFAGDFAAPTPTASDPNGAIRDAASTKEGLGSAHSTTGNATAEAYAATLKETGSDHVVASKRGINTSMYIQLMEHVGKATKLQGTKGIPAPIPEMGA